MAPAHKIRKIAVVFFVALVLAGCTVGPNYVRPPAPAAETFKEMDGWTKAAPADQLLRGKWWEVFNDPALNKLEEQVGISNQNVLAAEAQFRQAEALVRVARSAYFPTATIGPSISRSFQINAGGPFACLSLSLRCPSTRAGRLTSGAACAGRSKQAAPARRRPPRT